MMLSTPKSQKMGFSLKSPMSNHRARYESPAMYMGTPQKTLEESIAYGKRSGHLNLSIRELTAIPEDVVRTDAPLDMRMMGKNSVSLAWYDEEPITALDVSRNELKDLENIEQFPDLRRLDARFNTLTGAPEIDRLPGLTHVILSHNAIAVLPPPVLSLAHLVFLDLSHNKLTALPDLSSLTQLTSLHVSYNDLGDSPLLLPPGLVSLSLSACRRRELPVLDQPALLSLDLSKNFLRQTPALKTPLLRSLDLSLNLLGSLDDVLALGQNTLLTGASKKAARNFPERIYASDLFSRRDPGQHALVVNIAGNSSL